MDKQRFSELVEGYVQSAEGGYGKVAARAGLPKSTVYSWASTGSRPQRWQDLARFADALNLTKTQLNQLLVAADHFTVEQLLREDPDTTELHSWATKQQAAFHLPRRRVNSIVGRDRLFETIRRSIEKPAHCAAVVGMGGVGKSTLLYRLAQLLGNRFQHGVIWVEVNGDDSVPGVLHSLAQPFGFNVTAYDNLASRSHVVRHMLAQQDVLIVLDNLSSRLQIDMLLPYCGKCTVLPAAREPSLFDGLDCDVVTLPPLSNQESRALLRTFTNQVDDVRAEGAVQKLLSFVGGLPMALEIVGRFLATEESSVSLEQYVQLLEEKRERLQLLEATSGLSQSLYATFEASYERLSAETQHLFAQLGVFGGSDFSLEAVAAVTDIAPLKLRLLLRDLQHRGLLNAHTLDVNEVDTAHQRYSMHTLLQLFAAEKLSPTDSAMQRFATYFCRIAETFSTDYDVLDVEWLHIADALSLSATQDAVGLLKRGVDAVTMLQPGRVGYVDSRGHWRAATAWLRRLIALQSVDTTEQALLYCKLGALLLRQSEPLPAVQHLETARTLLESAPKTDSNQLLRAFLAEWLARYHTLHDREVALNTLEDATNLLTDTDETIGHIQRGNLLIIKGRVLAQHFGNFAEATEAVHAGLALLPDEPGTIRLNAYLILGTMAAMRGDMTEAYRQFAAGYQEATALGNQRERAILSLNLGGVEQRNGNLDKAAEHLRESAEICKQIGEYPTESGALNNLGAIERILGNDQAAITTLQSAIAIAIDHQLTREEAYAQTTLALVLLRQQHLAEAQTAVKRAISLAQTHQWLDLLPDVLSTQARILLQIGDHGTAQEIVLRAIESAESKNLPQQTGIAWSIRAMLLDATNERSLAAAAHQKAVALLAEQDVYELAGANFAYAQHLCRRAETISEGIELLQTAHAQFSSLRSSHDLTIVQAAMRQAGT